MPELTAERLRELLAYSPETGELRWRAARGNVAAGALAGSRRPDGYLVIRIDRRLHRANRLAWLIMTGEWPADYVDHRDRDPTNDRWANLRAATPGQNQQNRRLNANSTNGMRGCEVRHDRRGLIRVRIKVAGRRIHIGYFRSPADALAARAAAERLHFTHAAPPVSYRDARDPSRATA